MSPAFTLEIDLRRMDTGKWLERDSKRGRLDFSMIVDCGRGCRVIRCDSGQSGHRNPAGPTRSGGAPSESHWSGTTPTWSRVS